MERISIQTSTGNYPALVGSSLLGKIGELVRPLTRATRCALIADQAVPGIFRETIAQSLRDAGFEVFPFPLAPGETSKTLATAGELCEQMSRAGLDRSSFLVSLGGGVTGDLAGFVASIFLRGIPFVSVPTTLLAQVDSCIGGKTGVNSAAGKNLIGSFHQPILVLADTETLRTLPERIWNEGFAEAIKHGIIREPALLRASARITRDDCADFVARNIRLKAEIVAADEREENDTRSLLNFGHTIGHAIEHAAGYGNLLHGEALSLGLIAAAHVSVRRAGLSPEAAEEIRAALEQRHLPVRLPPDFPREKIFAALPRDKKFENGQIRFVVAHALGEASISSDVTMEDLRAAVDVL